MTWQQVMRDIGQCATTLDAATIKQAMEQLEPQNRLPFEEIDNARFRVNGEWLTWEEAKRKYLDVD